MEEKLISVVIPAYNAEKYIFNTIQNVLNQSYTFFDLIVVNDGSKDKTLEIIQSINDERLKVLSIENSGVSVARNKGVFAASTPYIAFLDADDYWENTYLEEIVDLIKTYPETKIFQTGRSMVYKDGLKRYGNPFLPKDNQRGLIDYISIIESFDPSLNSSDVVVSREYLIETGMFRENQKYFEDHDLWLRLCYNHKIAMVNKPLSFYRKDNEDATTTKEIRTKDIVSYLKTIAEVLNKLENPEQKKSLLNFSKKLIFTKFNDNRKRFSKKEKQEILLLSKSLIRSNLNFLIFWLLVKTNSYVLSRLVRRFFKMPPIY